MSGTDLFVVLAVVSAVFETKIFLKFGLYWFYWLILVHIGLLNFLPL